MRSRAPDTQATLFGANPAAWCIAGTDIPFTDERAAAVSDALGRGELEAFDSAGARRLLVRLGLLEAADAAKEE